MKNQQKKYNLNEEILIMYQQGGLSMEKISDILKISVGSVRNRIPKKLRFAPGRRMISLDEYAEEAGFVSLENMLEKGMSAKEIAYELKVSYSAVSRKIREYKFKK